MFVIIVVEVSSRGTTAKHLAINSPSSITNSLDDTLTDHLCSQSLRITPSHFHFSLLFSMRHRQMFRIVTVTVMD